MGQEGMSTDAFLIWSVEHRGWWMAPGLGFTSDITEAKRFTREDANGIYDAGVAAGHREFVLAEVTAMPIFDLKDGRLQ